MSDVDVDIEEWTDFDNRLLKVVEETMPRETKKFMRREGSRMKTATKREARGTIQKKTGNYLKGVKSSKAWQNAIGDYGVKVYNDHSIAPHTHLIEYGHRILTHKRVDTGKKAKAFYIYKRANEAFEKGFINDAKKFIYDLVDDGLKGN